MSVADRPAAGSARPGGPSAGTRRSVRRTIRALAFYTALVAGGVILLAPVLWMIAASLMTNADLLSSEVHLIPPTWHPENYVEIFTAFRFGRFVLNSVIVTGSVVVSNVIFCSMVGYGLAKFDFPGKNLVFGFILTTIMVPFTVLIIPLYLTIRELGWINSYPGLIVPFAMTAFGVFMMRQFAMSIPDDYLDAARVDGAGEFRIFLRIAVPLLRPAMAALAIVVFVINWDEFLWPLVVATQDQYRTLPIGLSQFLEQYENQWNLLMAGAVVAAFPVVLLFLTLQKRFLESMQSLAGLSE